MTTGEAQGERPGEPVQEGLERQILRRLADASEGYGRMYPEDASISRKFWDALSEAKKQLDAPPERPAEGAAEDVDAAADQLFWTIMELELSAATPDDQVEAKTASVAAIVSLIQREREKAAAKVARVYLSSLGYRGPDIEGAAMNEGRRILNR